MKFKQKENVYNRTNYISQNSPVQKELLRLFQKNSKLLILDIGGCEGEESIRYSKLFPFSAIFIFEPIPANQNLILENLKKFNIKNVQLIPAAVSNTSTVEYMYVSSGQPKIKENLDWDFGNKSSSLLVPHKDNNPKWLEFNEKIKVRTITLDKFLREKRFKIIDFIHLDVQGAEIKVLIGAENFLNSTKAIWMEVANKELYKNQPLRTDVEKFMLSKGFCLIKSKLLNEVGDQLYINKKYFKVFSLFGHFLIFLKKYN